MLSGGWFGASYPILRVLFLVPLCTKPTIGGRLLTSSAPPQQCSPVTWPTSFHPQLRPPVFVP
jgi:hypothetical protein